MTCHVGRIMIVVLAAHIASIVRHLKAAALRHALRVAQMFAIATDPPDILYCCGQAVYKFGICWMPQASVQGLSHMKHSCSAGLQHSSNPVQS